MKSEIDEIMEYLESLLSPDEISYTTIAMIIMIFSGSNTKEKFEKSVLDFQEKVSFPEDEKEKIISAYNNLPEWIASKLNCAIEAAFYSGDLIKR